MAKERQRPSSLAIVAFILALGAFLMSAVALFVAYDSGKFTRRARTLVEEIRGSLKKETMEEEWTRIQEKLADAKESLVKYKDTHLTATRLEEAKKMLVDYKEKIEPEYKAKIQALADKTDSVITAVKEQGKNAGEKLDGLMHAVDRLFRPEPEEPAEQAQSQETAPEGTSPDE